MKVGFKKSFIKDLKSITEQATRDSIRKTIASVEQAGSLQNINHLKKLKSGDRYYRIRVGDFRVGLIFDEDTVTFVRVLHRKDLYKYFP